MTVQSISQLVYDWLEGDKYKLNEFKYFGDRESGNAIDMLLQEALKQVDKQWIYNELNGIDSECSIEPLSFPTTIVIACEIENVGNLCYWKDVVSEHCDFDSEFSQSNLADLMKLAYESDLESFFKTYFDANLNSFFDVDFYKQAAKSVIEAVDFYSVAKEPFEAVHKKKVLAGLER